MCAGGAVLLLSLPLPEHPANSVAVAMRAPATRQAAHDRRISGLRSRPLDLIEPRSNRRTEPSIEHPCLTLTANLRLPGGREATRPAIKTRGVAATVPLTPSHQRELGRRHADR
jgi:hypothetical protein